MEENKPLDVWYEKTWLVIILCIIFFPIGLYALWRNSSISKGWKIAITILIVLSVIINLVDKTENASDKEVMTNRNITHVHSKDTMSLKTQIKNTIKSLDGDDSLAKSSYTSAQDFMIAGIIYKAYGSIISEGKKSNDKEIIELTNELEKKTIVSQRKFFPKIRKLYYEFFKDKLWENDVYVDAGGVNCTTIKLTSSYFNKNKNIKECQQAIGEILTLLRFKQSEYHWHKGNDDFTYYTIESLDDSDIGE